MFNNGNHNGRQMLRPAIVIGPGGTGNQVVRRLKMLVRDHYGDTPMLIHFLVADTDAGTFTDQNWSPLPELAQLERMPLYDPQVPFADVRENPGAYPEIHEWLPPTLDIGLLDRQDGAGQVRMLGRMAFYKSFAFFERRVDYIFTQCQRIHTQLEAMKRYEFDVAADPVIYVVSSICGGQGAGMLVDLAVALRTMAAGRFPSLNLIGVLAMPSVFADRIPHENRSKTFANAHATMKEIDYLMHSADKSKMRFRFPPPLDVTVTPHSPLFDICYLVDNCHGRGALGSAEEVYDQIATQLFLEIGTPFGARSESVRINLNSVAGLELDKVYRTGRRYSSFGNHTISFDREKISAWASLKSTSITVRDTLLGAGCSTEEIDRAIKDFLTDHRIDEAQPEDLTGAICHNREITQEQVTAAYAEDRPDHAELANDLWTRLDAFWLRRATDLRARMDTRVRTMLDGSDEEQGLLSAADGLIDQWLRHRGIAPALALTQSISARLRSFDSLLRQQQQNHQTRSQEHHQEAAARRDELLNLAQEADQLSEDAEDTSLFTRIWRAIQAFFSTGAWNSDELSDEELAQAMEELNLRAEEHRRHFLNHFNQAVNHRLNAEALAAASTFLSDAAARFDDLNERLNNLKQSLTKDNERLNEELAELDDELNNSRYINGNTMRRDVTADYVAQYLQMRFKRAQDNLLQWLLPETEFALTALESRYDAAELRARYAEHYAADILRREDRDSLAEMIERLHTTQTNGSLTSRIGEGLQFCLPFWNIRTPGNQFATEVLLVGLEQENPSVRDYLQAHAVAQRGQVYAQIVPTAQDSVILISRIAHGASYYWHAQDEIYYREYSHAQTFSNYPLHLRREWSKLPEPIPEPHKYQRRVFALGLAYEFIAVRGSAYYLDLSRQYSLAGTTRHTTADWRTIPLLSAVTPSEDAPQPANPNKADLIGDRSRWEIMQRFVGDERMVSSVRERLQELFNQRGREGVREELMRYCGEVLELAIGELEEEDLARIQLEIELSELKEVTDELKTVTSVLKLSR
jgi:hypothetical protein